MSLREISVIRNKTGKLKLQCIKLYGMNIIKIILYRVFLQVPLGQVTRN